MHPIITNKDIRFTEKILLKKGQRFDRERIEFIKNLDTIDLQAVPGSGKTTALLAKLMMLQKHQPFSDGAGILVISHTNAAVELFKEKIGNVCPKLFTYPNFVGTIQSFVDNFLAIPFYQSRYKKKINVIDAGLYSERMSRYQNENISGFNRQEQNRAKFFLHANPDLIYQVRYDWNNGRVELVKGLNGSPLTIQKPWPNSKNYQDFSNQEKENIKQWIFKLKKRITVEYGLLHFDDAYFFAKSFLHLYSPVIKIIQKRFRYVFVDEMQDMERHQINILEDLFCKKKVRNHSYQRIGDKNQAIFTSEVKLEDAWKDREKVLHIKKSNRLSQNIAAKVKPFGLIPFDLLGDNKEANEHDIKPRIIVYNDATITQVIPAFGRIIMDLKRGGQIPNDSKLKFRAIGWRKEKDEDRKIVLKDYHSTFNPDLGKRKIDYSCFEDYIFNLKGDKKLIRYIREALLNSIHRILRIEEIKDSDDRIFITNNFLKHLQQSHGDKHEALLLNLYNWSILALKKNIDELKSSFTDFIQIILTQVFDKANVSQATSDFINNHSENIKDGEDDSLSSNYYEHEDIKIEIGTVHSIKGETHCATLYLETFYQSDGRGATAKSYESQRLIEQLKGINISEGSGIRTKQSSRVMYVGFSRPTHLLCFAAHIGRINGHEQDLERNNWIVNTDLINVK